MKINYTILDWANKPITTLFAIGGVSEDGEDKWENWENDGDLLLDKSFTNGILRMQRVGKDLIRVHWKDWEYPTLYKIIENENIVQEK